LKVVDYIAKYIENLGIEQVFGYQGAAINPLIDAIVKTGKVKYIQAYHEQAAGFCADAYSRVTGKTGIALVTNGPGVTNLISAIANAHLDSVPCLFFTGQVNTFDINPSFLNIRQHSFQEVDTINMVKPVTKYAKTITDALKIKYELEKALYIANEGRKGTVLIDLPFDIQNEEIEEKYLDNFKTKEKSQTDDKILQKINQAAEMISKAKRPVVIVGGGLRSAEALNEFEKFIEITNMPSVSTLMGLDIFSKTNVGFSGLYGTTPANLTVYNADLMIFLGSRFSKRHFGFNRDHFNINGKIIHIDIDKHELNRATKEDLSINLDAKAFLIELNKQLNTLKMKDLSQWEKIIQKWQKKYENNTQINKNGLDPVKFISEISKYLPEDAIITTDVGQNQMWVAQGLKVKKNQRILTSGGLACMGFSLPAAIGAKLAQPNKNVFAFSGDGGFQMNLQELQMISDKKLNIKCFVFNNSTLGMIKELQHKFFGSRYNGTGNEYGVPDLKQIAKIYSMDYLKINKNYKIEALKQKLESKNPCLIEVELNKDNTFVLNKNCEPEIYKENLVKN